MESIQKEEKEIKNKNKLLIFLIILITIAVLAASGFAMYAWAKFSSQDGGTAQAPVAAWRFELKDGIVATENQIDFPVTRTDGKFDVVEEGTIAPGTWGEIPITVITTGTEVHMKYDINITIENCPTNLKFYKDAKHKKEFTTTRTEPQNGEGTKTATITIEKYIDKNEHKDNGEHQHIIYWYWPFETGKGNQIDNNDLVDSEDMHLGMATMAITATGMQVLELQDDPDYVPDTIYALFEKSTGTLKLSHNPFMDYAAEDEYYTGVENVVSSSPMWYSQSSNILNVEIIDEIRPKSTYNWFYGCTNLARLDLHNLNTENVTTMNRMFCECTGLTSLDVSEFDTSSVTDMFRMFTACTGLTSLDVSGFDTSSVTNMSGMFFRCTGLTSLDVSGFDTSSVTSMDSMFNMCTRLTSLDVSGFDTSSVTNMITMFSGCAGLTSLDVSGFDTSSVTNMSSMFSGCTGLTSLDVSGFDTSSVTNMTSMFSMCTRLTSLDVSGFDTSSVTNMITMFSGCAGLTSLDVSGFDTSSVTNMSYMFERCTRLTTVYASKNFTTDKVSSSSYMFRNCTKLKGGNGTAYISSKIDKTYARIDTAETPGYFTEKTN